MKYCYAYREEYLECGGYGSIADALEDARLNADEDDHTHCYIGEQTPGIELVNFLGLAESVIEWINEQVEDEIDDLPDAAFGATQERKNLLADILRKFVEDNGGIAYYTAKNLQRYNLKTGEVEE